jgi:hypothetical protein
MRDALAHAGKSGRRAISAFIATAVAQDEAAAASDQRLEIRAGVAYIWSRMHGRFFELNERHGL